MTKKKEKTERIFTNPFSDAFLPTWDLWKTYKKEEFKFSYKSVITEQAAMQHLVELSGGNELVACNIVKQSMQNGWKGFFELKSSFGNGNQQRNRNNNNSQATRQSVNDIYADRFGKRG